MKNKIFILFITLFVSTLQVSKAQEKSEDKYNYIVLSQKIQQLKPIILAAQNLALEDGDKFGEFHVVICGEAIKAIHQKEFMKENIDFALKNDVKLFACELSMKKFDIEKSQIPKNMGIVKNGLLYNFQLQKKGFKSITL